MLGWCYYNYELLSAGLVFPLQGYLPKRICCYRGAAFVNFYGPARCIPCHSSFWQVLIIECMHGGCMNFIDPAWHYNYMSCWTLWWYNRVSLWSQFFNNYYIFLWYLDTCKADPGRTESIIWEKLYYYTNNYRPFCYY